MVQGVGFRPFIYQLATRNALKGVVGNRGDGVFIILQEEEDVVKRFRDDILQNAPAASHIKSVEIKKIPVSIYNNFYIASTDNTRNIDTEISPDISVCDDCLHDLKTQSHRLNYPFINCTHCGPRFSIIKDLPYDRNKTTMSDFEMCPACAGEYRDKNDRRFHAQPVACNFCGPEYLFENSNERITDIDRILSTTGEFLKKGKIIALKGQGGYHLVCDALNDKAVGLLRSRKKRDGKPFAVLFKDLNAVKEYCFINDLEELEISSWRKPIILLTQKKPLAPSVNRGLNTIGAILPYMPVHYLLFEKLDINALVLTSGNISEEPLVISDIEAKLKFNTIADAIVSYNREIYNRTDDSVLRVIKNKISVIRRSRGFVPAPADLDNSVSGILAVGAEQKNCFCMGIGNQAVLSQHIGDLKNSETYSFYKESIERFTHLFRFVPEYIVCDLHPDYMSARFARALAQKLNIPLLEVQHHHAHIVSCMAEHKLHEKVIGVSFDGTGYGTDGGIWGGEFLIADECGFDRFMHFDYAPMPGGEKVIDEPWRMAYSYLYKYFGNGFNYNSIPSFRGLDRSKTGIISEMLSRGINSPLTSSSGRLFDTIAALTGICILSGFDSEPPMRLETYAKTRINESYPFSLKGNTISFEDTFRSVLKDIPGNDTELISTKFHNMIAHIIEEVSLKIRRETGINKVVLSGGVFQNKFLLEKASHLLADKKFEIFCNNLFPSNDGGIALGQIVIASKKRELCV